MDYSAAERERAAEQIAEMELVCLPKFNLFEHEGVLGLQMELNRAVALLRKIAILMPEKEIVITLAPDSGLGIRRYPLDRGLTDAQIVEIHDFLSHYPEGELR